jgi:hypothetical protein
LLSCSEHRKSWPNDSNDTENREVCAEYEKSYDCKFFEFMLECGT